MDRRLTGKRLEVNPVRRFFYMKQQRALRIVTEDAEGESDWRTRDGFNPKGTSWAATGTAASPWV
jgi:hypothetical protein